MDVKVDGVIARDFSDESLVDRVEDRGLRPRRFCALVLNPKG
jgi:hypothetical protein